MGKLLNDQRRESLRDEVLQRAGELVDGVESRYVRVKPEEEFKALYCAVYELREHELKTEGE